MTYLIHYIYIYIWNFSHQHFAREKNLPGCGVLDRAGYIAIANVTPTFSTYMPKFGVGCVPQDVHILILQTS